MESRDGLLDIQERDDSGIIESRSQSQNKSQAQMRMLDSTSESNMRIDMPM